jgi:hypothetical protein
LVASVLLELVAPGIWNIAFPAAGSWSWLDRWLMAVPPVAANGCLSCVWAALVAPHRDRGRWEVARPFFVIGLCGVLVTTFVGDAPYEKLSPSEQMAVDNGAQFIGVRVVRGVGGTADAERDEEGIRRG